MAARDFEMLARDVRDCRICEKHLPFGPRPIFQAHPDARVLIVGQAPGRRVHESGKPFNDPSGVRLRNWLGMDEETFYDARSVALLPMGFCFPGTGSSGDLPPRPECAAEWRGPLLEHLGNIRLTLVLGRYAMAWHVPEARGTLVDIIGQWRERAPKLFVAPHPSPRNQRWLKSNPWFEDETVPALRKAVARALRQG